MFFSGGSALKTLSAKLVEYTWNSIHLITPFDSGGSSFHLREAFGILAVGDIRNRMTALANTESALLKLFSHRLEDGEAGENLLQTLNKMADGEHPLVKNLGAASRENVCGNLRLFREKMPESFDLRGASIGNLVLVGGLLKNDQDIEAMISLFRKLLAVRGVVRPISKAHLHLGAKLEDGSTVIGQHRITHGTEEDSGISEIFLNENLTREARTSVSASQKAVDSILEADLICYPYGSFYSSLNACLLPDGVGEAVAKNPCTKVYVPNLRGDIEQRGMTVFREVQVLLRNLKAAGQDPRKFIDTVLVDEKSKIYDRPIEVTKIENLGLRVLRSSLAGGGGGYIDEHMVSALLGLA